MLLSDGRGLLARDRLSTCPICKADAGDRIAQMTKPPPALNRRGRWERWREARWSSVSRQGKHHVFTQAGPGTDIGPSANAVSYASIGGRVPGFLELLLTDERMERRLAAVLAADVAGYSRLMGLDEEGTLARLKAVRKVLVDPSIAKHRGRIVKTTGDGMLVEFVSAVDAARCSVEVQMGMAEQNGSVPQNTRIEFRIGIHVGDIIFDDNDIFGDGVNIAARLESIADAGGVCMSDDAYRQIRGKVEIACDDLGSQSLKNIAEPMRAWRVRFGGQGAATLHSVSQTPALTLPDKPSIAVLPFQNMSGDPEQEYFADGMVEDIITELSRIKGLLVIARNSSFTYKGQSVDIKKVAGELGVRYVLEGSVRRAGKRIRVTAQLIEAQAGSHVWAERYDRDVVDIFDLQDEITRSLVSAIQTEMILLEGSLAERSTTPNFKIWEMAKKAYPLFYGLTRESLAKAGELARAMIGADPTSPEGHRLLSLVDLHLVFMGFTEEPEKLKKEALSSNSDGIEYR